MNTFATFNSYRIFYNSLLYIFTFRRFICRFLLGFFSLLYLAYSAIYFLCQLRCRVYLVCFSICSWIIMKLYWNRCTGTHTHTHSHLCKVIFDCTANCGDHLRDAIQIRNKTNVCHVIMRSEKSKWWCVECWKSANYAYTKHTWWMIYVSSLATIRSTSILIDQIHSSVWLNSCSCKCGNSIESAFVFPIVLRPKRSVG